MCNGHKLGRLPGVAARPDGHIRAQRPTPKCLKVLVNGEETAIYVLTGENEPLSVESVASHVIVVLPSLPIPSIPPLECLSAYLSTNLGTFIGAQGVQAVTVFHN